MAEGGNNQLRGLTRAAWAAVGLGWFFWLGFEDSSAGTVVLLAGLVCLAAGITLIARKRALDFSTVQHAGALRAVLAAGLLGAAVGPVAALLMVVKTGLHGHIPPDFSLQDVLNMLQRIPVWAMAGGLLGLAWWLGVKVAGSHGVR